MLDFLAQTTPSSGNIMGLMLALGVLIVVIGGLLAFLSFYRRKMHGDVQTGRDFSLQDLRRLHNEGQLTADEFERAKARLVGTMHASLLKDKKPSKHEAPMESEPKDVE